jgi:hypothetical protein
VPTASAGSCRTQESIPHHRELTVGVLTELALAHTETVVVVELVALNSRVAGEVGEERTAACLDCELTQDRILDPHQPGHRVDQHGVRGETVEQNSCYMSKMSSTVMEPFS